MAKKNETTTPTPEYNRWKAEYIKEHARMFSQSDGGTMPDDDSDADADAKGVKAK